MRATIGFIMPVVIGALSVCPAHAQAPAPIPRVLAPNSNIGAGTPLLDKHLNSDPPFAHWDLRLLPHCAVPWSLGPSPVPDLDADGTPNTFTDRFLAQTAFTNAFGQWEGVTPALIGFTNQPRPPAVSGLAMDSYNTLDFDGHAPDDSQVVNVGLVMAAGGMVIHPGPDGILQTQPAGDDRVVGNTIIDGGNGISDTRKNNFTSLTAPLAYTALFMNTHTGQILESDIIFTYAEHWVIDPTHNLCDGANNVTAVNLRGVATHEIGHFIGVAHPDMPQVFVRDLADGNTPTMYPAISPPFCGNSFNETLENSDQDACNFLYCQDLGDAADPCSPSSGLNNLPTLVSFAGAGPLLNNLRMDGRMLGAGHIFGIKSPYRDRIYTYEWLERGSFASSGGVDAECRPNLVDKDLDDDGLAFVPNPPVWGRKLWVFAEIKYATDHDGKFHNYVSGKPLYLNTWIDLNQDCIWQEGAEHFIEKSFTPGNSATHDDVHEIDTGGVTILPRALPKPYSPIWLRARLDYNENVGRVNNIDQTLGLTRGFAQFGEVEDYPFYCGDVCIRLQSTNPYTYATSLNVVVAGNVPRSTTSEAQLGPSGCRTRVISSQYQHTYYSAPYDATILTFGDQSYIPPGAIWEVARCQDQWDGPQTLLQAYWQPYNGSPTLSDVIPTTHSSLSMTVDANGNPENMIVHVGCLNDSIGGLIGGNGATNIWDDSLHVDVYYRVSPTALSPSQLNPCDPAYYPLPRQHAGSQWINPENPLAFSLPFGPDLQAGQSFILEISSSWSINGNTATEFTEFPKIFPASKPGTNSEPRKPTIEVAPVVRPNPSNPTASIQYELPASMRVTLEIFDVNGRLVRQLIAGEPQVKGPHAVEWNGRNSSGAEVSSGVYFCRLQAGTTVTSTKLVVLR